MRRSSCACCARRSSTCPQSWCSWARQAAGRRRRRRRSMSPARGVSQPSDEAHAAGSRLRNARRPSIPSLLSRISVCVPRTFSVSSSPNERACVICSKSRHFRLFAVRGAGIWNIKDKTVRFTNANAEHAAHSGVRGPETSARGTQPTDLAPLILYALAPLTRGPPGTTRAQGVGPGRLRQPGTHLPMVWCTPGSDR
jgi:hypothetical protein